MTDNAMEITTRLNLVRGMADKATDDPAVKAALEQTVALYFIARELNKLNAQKQAKPETSQPAKGV
jgi:hypothetical protein